MRYCPMCGTGNEDSALFCENCGSRLDGAAGTQPGQNVQNGPVKPQPGQEQPVKPQPRQEKPRQEQPVKPQPKPQPKQKGQIKLSGIHIAVIIEAVCLVAAVAAFFFAGWYRYSPQTAAKQYFNAYAAHDWAGVYSMLELPEGGFLQESQFEEIMENSQIPDITNFSVMPLEGGDEGIVRNFNVEYSTSGQGVSNYVITLVKQSDRALFLFDRWKVSSAGMLADGYPVTVPAGAKVAVDGVELTDEYKTQNGDGSDVYQISIFNGVHSISVAVPWCEVYEESFDTSSGGTYVDSLSLSEDGKAALESKMQEVLEKFYTSAMAGEDYSAVAGLFTESAAGEAEAEYNNLREDLAADPDSRYTLNQISFDNFSSEFYVGSGSVSGDLECDYTVDYTYTYSGFGLSRTENDNYDSTAYMSASFVFDGETYKIQDINVPSVWWY